MKHYRHGLIATVLLFACALPLVAPAQTTNTPPAPPAIADTNSIPLLEGPAVEVVDFLSHGSNWMVAPYGIYSTETHKVGAGLGLFYKVSDYLAPGLRVDWFDGDFWMPSGQVQLQAPVTLMQKVTVVPFVFTGIGTPLGGGGNQNHSAVGIFGAGAAVRLSDRFDLVGDFEKWTEFEGKQVRFGCLIKF